LEPMKPAPPVTTTRIFGAPFMPASIAFRGYACSTT
jgi:hypothetical protein